MLFLDIPFWSFVDKALLAVVMALVVRLEMEDLLEYFISAQTSQTLMLGRSSINLGSMSGGMGGGVGQPG